TCWSTRLRAFTSMHASAASLAVRRRSCGRSSAASCSRRSADRCGVRAVQRALYAAVLFASAATASAASPAEGGDSPEWLLAPYLWAPDFKGTVGLGGITLPLDVRADEMLRDVDAGAM